MVSRPVLFLRTGVANRKPAFAYSPNYLPTNRTVLNQQVYCIYRVENAGRYSVYKQHSNVINHVHRLIIYQLETLRHVSI